MKKYMERVYNGNKGKPHTCLNARNVSDLAVTTTGNNGLYMGLITTVVLAISNLVISALRKVIPDKVRICIYSNSCKSSNCSTITTRRISTTDK